MISKIQDILRTQDACDSKMLFNPLMNAANKYHDSYQNKTNLIIRTIYTSGTKQPSGIT